tara:strand:+ start:1644 stop:2795 length:1152 start_codon:yes stop_codon:yes gene_type:complete
LSYQFRDLEYLYIHWPFCPYKCHFCDFVAMASHEQFMKDYHTALCREITYSMKDITTKPLKTIYMGGGTPSTYPPELLLDMFGTLKKNYIFNEQTEVTIEVNPGTANKALLKAWHSAGINRLSIGVQSLKDQILKSLNRHQTAKDVYALLTDASEYFENLSVDFILGLPGVSDDEWKLMIREAMKWPIKHISVYFLMVHENTPLYFKVKTKKLNLPPDDATVDLYNWTVDTLAQHGFERYELSNFAQKGFESRHNQVYWDRKPYRGYGLGACSFNGNIRFQNSKNLGNYLEKVSQDISPVDMSEELTSKQINIEKIMLGLRCQNGMNVTHYVQELQDKEKIKFFKELDYLSQANLIDYADDIVRLTPKGFALENEVAVRLFPD